MEKKLYWTKHAKSKMGQYRLSKSRLIRVLYKPERVEKGIAPGTIALMQSIFRPLKQRPTKVPKKKKASEIWLMYQDKGNKRKIITAWRYPGESPIGEKLPIPQDIRYELLKNKNYEF